MTNRSNIFTIDIDAVLRAVTEANAGLALRHRELMAALDRVPDRLETDDDIAKAKSFAVLIKTHLARCRSTRLADTKPLRDLVKQVEQVFKSMEQDSKEAQTTIAEGLRLAAEQHSPARTSVAFMIDKLGGEVLGSAVSAPPQAAHPSIPLEWDVATVSPAELDLEALRPYLTERVLLSAAKRHLKENGPQGLNGVTYVQRAVV